MMVDFAAKACYRRHLYQDLRPYTCIFQSCVYRDTPFKNRDDWTDHIGIDHRMAPDWASILCPLCQKETGEGRSECSIHIATHLELIALDALPFECDSDNESDHALPLGCDADNTDRSSTTKTVKNQFDIQGQKHTVPELHRRFSPISPKEHGATRDDTSVHQILCDLCGKLLKKSSM
jgi:hypothetical protein